MEKTKKNVYEMITDRIIEKLESGNIPWISGFNLKKGGSYNRITSKNYSLLNQLTLKHSGEYASYKQWQELGGHVKAGEKGECVFFWNVKEKEEIEKDENGNEEKKIKKIWTLRYYTVFHISQVEGVEPITNVIHKDSIPLEDADETLSDYLFREHIQLKETTNNRKEWNDNQNIIYIPEMKQYKSSENYYADAFALAAKSTVEPLKRKEDVAKEEMISEIASATILSELGLEREAVFTNQAAYIGKWIRALKENPRLIVSITKKAEEAAKYIMGEAI